MQPPRASDGPPGSGPSVLPAHGGGGWAVRLAIARGGEACDRKDRPVSYIYNNMMAPTRLPVSEAQLNAPADTVMLWDGYGPKQSPVQKTLTPVDGVTYPVNFYREYSAWGNLAEYLVDPADGLPRHSGGGNVIYMDLHARWKRYGIGSNQKEWLQSVKDAFPFATAVDPGGVGAMVGEKDWLW